MTIKRPVSLYPFLIAIYPALFLYSRNIHQYRLNVLVQPVIFSIVVAFLISLLSIFIAKQKTTRSVISAVIILLFFSYEALKYPFAYLHTYIGKFYIDADLVLTSVYLLVIPITVYIINRFSSLSNKIDKLLRPISVTLLVISIFNITRSEVLLGRMVTVDPRSESLHVLAAETSAKKPDIYYLIFDRYAGQHTLNSYGFDNSSFTGYLKDKGFFVNTDATSNYPKTFLSIASSLNMRYLDDFTAKTNGGSSSDESLTISMIQQSQVSNFLKDQGYSFFQVGSGWDPTRFNPYADRNFSLTNASSIFTNEFTSGFVQTTLAAPVIKVVNNDPTAISQMPTDNDHRSRILYAFDSLLKIPDISGPKFVFSHILVPHGPYVLGKNCEPISEQTTNALSEKENYLNQLNCANQKIEQVIDKILSASEKPIIIIQADEGPYPILNELPGQLSWATASDKTLIEKFPVLSAVYLPSQETTPFYDGETPVNTFRIIFNTYFKTQLPLLPDKNYIFSDAEHLYQFTDITNKIKTVKEYATKN